MRVLHVISSPRAEGTVRLTLDWLRSGAALEQHVLALSATPADLSEELRARAAGYAEGGSLPAGLAKFLWIVRCARSRTAVLRPDLVLCWNTGFSSLVLLGVFLAGLRTAFLAHAGNPPTPGVKGTLHGWITASVLWASGARMICCSHYVAQQFRRDAHFPSALLASVWNCAQVEEIGRRATDARSRRTRREFTAVMVATLEAHKDHVTLLRAWKEVARIQPGAELWLVGGGSLHAGLEALARQIGVAPMVRFLGSRTDVAEILGQVDLFVFSTTMQEGLGTVLIEALAAGLPVIASDVPACRELLDGGRRGELVPPRCPGLLAQAILRRTQATNEPVAVSLAEFGVERMQRHYLDLAQVRTPVVV